LKGHSSGMMGVLFLGLAARGRVYPREPNSLSKSSLTFR